MEILKTIRKNILLILALVIVLFISSQFVVMATVSTRGADIGYIRRQQDEIRLENEQLRAKINQAKTKYEVLQGVQAEYRLETAKPKQLTNL